MHSFLFNGVKPNGLLWKDVHGTMLEVKWARRRMTNAIHPSSLIHVHMPKKSLEDTEESVRMAGDFWEVEIGEGAKRKGEWILFCVIWTLSPWAGIRFLIKKKTQSIYVDGKDLVPFWISIFNSLKWPTAITKYQPCHTTFSTTHTACLDLYVTVLPTLQILMYCIYRNPLKMRCS